MHDEKHTAAFTLITAGVAILGLRYELLLAGFAGGLVTLSYVGNASFWRCMWLLFMSTLTAAYTAPVVGLWVATQFPFPDTGLPFRFSAFLIGAGTQWIVPGFIALLKTRLPVKGEPND